MNKPGPHFLNWQVWDASMRFMAAPKPEKLSHAIRLVQAKFDRGDYADILQALDAETRASMAGEMVKRLE